MIGNCAPTVGSYWCSQGRFQAEYDRLWKRLVPKEGECPIESAEMLRVAGRLYHDRFNNGCCNRDNYREWARWLWRRRGTLADHVENYMDDTYTRKLFREAFKWVCGQRKHEAFKELEYREADIVMDVVVSYCSLVHPKRKAVKS